MFDPEARAREIANRYLLTDRHTTKTAIEAALREAYEAGKDDRNSSAAQHVYDSTLEISQHWYRAGLERAAAIAFDFHRNLPTSAVIIRNAIRAAMDEAQEGKEIP